MTRQHDLADDPEENLALSSGTKADAPQFRQKKRALMRQNAPYRAALLAVIGLALLVGGKPAEALRHPSAPRCPVFPASNAWNTRVDRLPVAANSDAIVRSWE